MKKKKVGEREPPNKYYRPRSGILRSTSLAVEQSADGFFGISQLSNSYKERGGGRCNPSDRAETCAETPSRRVQKKTGRAHVHNPRRLLEKLESAVSPQHKAISPVHRFRRVSRNDEQLHTLDRTLKNYFLIYFTEWKIKNPVNITFSMI